MVCTKEIKAVAELKLPKKVDNNIGKAFKDFSQAIKTIASPLSKIAELYLVDAPCTLFAPVSAYLKGKSYEIERKYNTFQNQIEIRKELSQAKMAQYVLENLVTKEQKKEELPYHINDTDNLFAIQNAASETTDEDFIKFWARLYTEEACKPNIISKKTINLCKNLDKNIVKILEDDIFPYCDEKGFYFGNMRKNLKSILLTDEYGFTREVKQKYTPEVADVFMGLKIGQYVLYTFPGYEYYTEYEGRILTQSALEIKNCLKIDKNISIDDILPQLIESSKNWQINEKFRAYMTYKNEKGKFFITENDIIIYPYELKGKNITEVYKDVLNNIEYKEEAKKFFVPEKTHIILHMC